LFRSTLISFLDGNSDVLERLVTEIYARGLSTRDIEDAFRDVTGELLISRSAVSEITDGLWADYQEFTARDLSEIEVEYLFTDAVFESLRARGAKEALLVAWCIAADGRKHLLHLAVGNKESEGCWTEFFRNMLSRGMRLPTTITSDGAPGLIIWAAGPVSEDRHNPLPHIALLTTALKSAYRNTEFLSTRTAAELRELLVPGGRE
jgi:putative transposase